MADLNTEIRIGADASGVEAGVGKAKRSLRDLSEAAKSAGDSVANAGDKAGKSLAGMGDGGDAAARKIQRDTNVMQGSLQRYLATLEAGSKDSRKYWEVMADFKGIDKNALRPLLDQLDAYKAKTKDVNESTVSWFGSLTKIGATAAGVAAVAATAGVAAKAMFEASASAERLRTMLDFSTGGNSAKEIEYLRGVTFRLGLEFNSTAKAYGQFQAAAKGTALEGDKARAVFESVAKASAVMGLSAADTSGVLLALQQMISKGTVQAEELRGQLGERLPGAFQIAAKAMGVTTGELGKMLEQGQVIADDFLPKFAAALDKNIGGASEKAAQRLDASVNRVATAWDRLKQNGGDSGVSSFMAGQYEILADGFNGISEAMEKARSSGSGFVGQMAAGAAAAAKFANPLQGVSYSAIETGNALKQAEAEFAALQKRGDVMGGNIYYKAEMANLSALIKELKAAQAEKQKLATGAAANMNEGVIASGRAREQFMNRRAKDEEAANAFRLKQAGVPDGYLKDMAELIRLNEAGVIVGKEYTDALKKQQEELLKKTGVTKGSNAAATQEQNAYESLIASVRAKIAEDKLELDGGLALTESQKIRIKLDQDLAAGRVKLSAAREKEIRQDIDALAASEAELAARRALNKANIEAGQTREKYLASLSTGLDKIRADIQAQEDATARMGLTKEAVAELDAAKLEMLATDAELQAIKALDRNLDQQTYDALKEQAKLYRDLAAAKKGGAAKEAALDLEKANAEAAKKAQEDWQRASDDINRSLTDALLRGFESGKDFAKNLRDTVANMFKTLVLRPIISAVVNPVAGAITGALGLAGTANAATSGASTLGGIGNIASLGSNLFSSGLGSTISGAIGSGVGALFGTTAGNAALGTSLGLGAGSATAAAAAAAQAGGASAAAAASAASTGASIAGAIPYIGAAVAALTLLAGKFKGETRYGGGFEVVNGKAFRTTGDVTKTLPESAIVQSVQGTFDSINKILGQYGSEFVATNIKAGIETSGKGRGGVFAGGLLSGGGATDIKFGKFFEDRIGASLNPEEAVKAFGGELNKAVIAALQAATDLPKYVQRQIESVDVNALGADKAAELLQTIGNLPNVLLQGFGTTRDALAQQFAQGLALGDATAAGQSVADTLVASIEASLYNDAAGKIFDIVNSGIVAPMLDAIATGASVSEALSQATIDKTIERAKAQASALSELFGNAEFVSALEQIRTTVGAALGQAGDSFGYTPKFQLQAAQQIDTAAQSASTAAQSASTAADEAARAWQQITDGLLTDRTTAEIALLRAQGREEEALARERAKAIEGFDAYQIGLYDGTQAILSQVTALEKQAEATKLAQDRAAELASTLAGELPGVIDKFLSPDQRLAAGYTGIASDLSKVGINVDSGALATASLDQIAAAAMAVYNLGTTSDETRLAILRAASGLADLKDASNAANIASTDTAYAALERAVTKQRGILEETVADVREVFDAVRTASRELFGEVEGAAAMQARAGRKFISDSLSSAKLTGYLPDGKDLQEAIGAARAGIGASVYASQADADYERLVLANELRDLQSISGDQLTEAEKQIKALDDILTNARDQLDALRGINSAVLSVADALANFNAAMNAEKAGAAGAGGAGGAGGAAGAGGAGGAGGINSTPSMYGPQDAAGAAQYISTSPTGSSYRSDTDLLNFTDASGMGQVWWGRDIRSEAAKLVDAGQTADVVEFIRAAGFTLDQADSILQLPAGTAEEVAAALGIPKFATGTNYIPGNMLAMVHEGEAIVPKAYNPAAGGAGNSGNAKLEALVEALTAEVQRLQSVVNDGNREQRRTANAVNGTPEMPMVVAIA